MMTGDKDVVDLEREGMDGLMTLDSSECWPAASQPRWTQLVFVRFLMLPLHDRGLFSQKPRVPKRFV
jgi:hypothetical protein